MKKLIFYITVCLGMLSLVGCTGSTEKTEAEKNPFACAIFLSNKIEDDLITSLKGTSSMVNKLNMLAQVYAKFGQKAKSLKLLTDNLKNVMEMKDFYHRALALIYMSETYTEIGEETKALEMLSQALMDGQRLESAYTRADIPFRIVKVHLEVGRFDQALAVANKIEEADIKVRSLVDISDKYIKTRQNDKALDILFQAVEVAKTIKRPVERTSRFSDIGVKYIEAGQSAKAIEILILAVESIKTVDDTGIKAINLSYIPPKYVKAGGYDKAFEIADLIEDPHYKLLAFVGMADTFIEVGQSTKASEMLSKALEVINQTDQSIIPEAIRQIAIRYAQIGQYDQALEVVNMIKMPHVKSEASGNIGLVCVKAGQYDQALKFVTLIEKPDNAITPLTDMAVKLAEAGRYDQAIKVTNTMSPYFRDKALAEMVGIYAKAGNYDEAHKIANLIEKPYDKVIALTDISDKYIDDGQKASAIDSLSQASENAKKVEYVDERDDALFRVIDKYAKIGDYEKALQLVKTIESPALKVSSLVAVDLGYIKTGQKVDDRAKKILREIINQ